MKEGTENREKRTYKITAELDREAYANLLYVARSKNISEEKALESILKTFRMIPLIEGNQSIDKVLDEDQKVRKEIEDYLDSFR